MKILVTGAKGFVGKNLTESLKNLRDGKDRTRSALSVEEVMTYDIDSDPAALAEYSGRCDFVFHLAGVNRPQDPAEFTRGNVGFLQTLLSCLREKGNTCPVMLSSSVQASLQGRYAGSPYGESKAEAERVLLAYARETGARPLIYRLPNLFGKWCRPGYNSAVATFCHQAAHGLPLTVNDPSVQLHLLYIDDLVNGLLDALEGRLRPVPAGEPFQPENPANYYLAGEAHKVTLGEIAALLGQFAAQPQTLTVPEIPDGSFAKKLYSAYLSYLPAEKAAFPLKKNEDARGSFTELLKTVSGGQFSVNVSNPGVTKGQHWHHSKWEFFIVVSGRALIRQRKVGGDEVLEFRVSGEEPTAVHMLPGYTHSIENLSPTEKLITLMWANECFDPSHPDTFFEPV